MKNQRFLFIGSACVLAAVVFLLTLFLGSSPSSDTQTTGEDSTLEALSGWGNWSHQDSAVGAPNIRKLSLHFGGAEEVQYDLFGDTLNPKPQGVIDITRPVAHIHLVPGKRVIQIEADQGTFVAPGPKTSSTLMQSYGDPQSGILTGHVELRLFENPTDGPIDLNNDSPHQVLTLFLDQARFNRDLGQIIADGPVRIVGKDMEFSGQNLDLTYSPLKRRVNRLEIEKGDYLIFKQRAKAPVASTDPSSTIKPTTPNSTATNQDSQSDQFYRLTLHDRVKILADNHKIEGDQLEVLFSMSPGSPAPGSPAPGSPAPGSPGSSSKSSTSSPEQIRSKASATEETISDPAARREVTVTWHGPLLILPLEEKPAELRDGEDTSLRLVGRPARITPPDEDRIAMAQMSYLASQSEVVLVGSKQFPLTIDSNKLGGIITADRFVLHMDQATAQLQGPGTLNAQARGRKSHKGQLPPGTSIAWEKQVDLAFYTKSNRTELDAIKEITFGGDVVIEHPQFDLNANEVKLNLASPQEGRQQTQSVTAKGNVNWETHSANAKEELTLHTDQAEIEFEQQADGNVQPARIIATGNVITKQKGQTLWTDELVVELHTPGQTILANASTGTEPSATKPKDPTSALDQMLLTWESPDASATENASGNGLSEVSAPAATKHEDDSTQPASRVRQVRALGHVRVKLEDKNIQLYAHRLIGNEQKIEFFGQPEKPAQILQKDGRLVGQHIVLIPQTQDLQVIGAGMLDFDSEPIAKEPAQPVTDEKQPAVQQAPAIELARINITWHDQMNYNHQAREAKFTGQVQLQAMRDLAATHVRGESVRILFNSFELDDNGQKPVQQGRQVRMVYLRKNAEFLEESWVDKVGGKLATRLRLKGEDLIFDAVPETITVPGKGTLLYEDHRLPVKDTETEKTTAAEKPKKSFKDKVKFTGQGATLFSWQGQFLLNLAHNDMTMRDQVQMLHLPSEDDNGIQLDCRHFMADMASTGGLGTWLSADPTQPELKIVQASHDVRILAFEREITTDRAVYTHHNRKVKLRADKGKLTRITTPGSTSEPGAELIVWDLPSNKLYIARPGRINHITKKR